MEKSKSSKLVDKEIKTNNFNQMSNHDRNQFQNIHQHQNVSIQQQQNMNIHQNANIQQQNQKSKFTHSGGSNKFPPGFGPHQRGHFPKPPQQVSFFLFDVWFLTSFFMFLTCNDTIQFISGNGTIKK